MIRLAALVVLLMASCLQAHSLHQSTAEAEYNAETKKLEVSLTVFINDLELALIRHSERMMSLEKTPAAEFDEQIRSYLAKTFVVTDVTGRPAKIEWVGREIDAENAEPTVTLFFEVPLSLGITNATLQHSIFCDLFKDQINLMSVLSGGFKAELRFSRDQAMRKIQDALGHKEAP